MDQYRATYNPHHHVHQPQMFNVPAAHQDGQLEHLQREFLDSTQREFKDLHLADSQFRSTVTTTLAKFLLMYNNDTNIY